MRTELESLKGKARKAQPGGQKERPHSREPMVLAVLWRPSAQLRELLSLSTVDLLVGKQALGCNSRHAFLFLKLSLDHVLANVLLQRKVLILKIKFTGDKLGISSGISACLDQENLHSVSVTDTPYSPMLFKLLF